MVKPLPQDISFNGRFHTVNDVEFLSDITYVTEDGNERQEQAIFRRIYHLIDDAEEFIVIDMFLFNDDYDRNYEFPELSMELSNALVEKRKEEPDMEIVFITDRINSVYGTYTIEQLDRMKESGIKVIETDMRKLDSMKAIIKLKDGAILALREGFYNDAVGVTFDNAPMEFCNV